MTSRGGKPLAGGETHTAETRDRRSRATRLVLALIALPCLSACTAQLPEPESEGAMLYVHRCDTCHRLYAPGSLKYEMWRMQVERMQGEMVRRGIPPLTEQEHTLLLGYLRRHSG